LPAPLTFFTGGFHFSPDPRDLDVFFKVIQFPEKILAFYGALSNFEYTILLTDTTTGRTIEFRNPAGGFCGGFVNNVLSSNLQ